MPFIASMGIYVAKASVLKELLTRHFPTGHDFGSEIIPGAKDLGYRVQVSSCDIPSNAAVCGEKVCLWTSDNSTLSSRQVQNVMSERAEELQ